MEITFFDLQVMLIGLTAGYISGLVPAIGLVILLLICYPFLLEWQMFHLLLFYMSAASAAQFSGSILSTTMGIPGESSSLPAVKEGNALFYKGQGSFAISGAAIGSALGAFITCAGVLLIMPVVVDIIAKYYNNIIQLTMICIASAIVIFVYGRNLVENVILFVFGTFLASIGLNTIPYKILYEEWFPYEYLPDSVKYGLPIFPVVVALFVVPILYQSWNIHANKKIHQDYEDKESIVAHLTKFWKNLASSLRGSAVGTLGGLIPHVGVPLSTNVAYALEKSKRSKHGLYKKGDYASLVSAETSNNSAVFMQLMPLVLLGIPITTSEAILLSIIERTSYGISFEDTVLSGLFATLMFFFVIVNLVCLALSWPLAKWVTLIGKIPLKYIFSTTLIVLVGLVYYVGERQYEGLYYMSVLVALLPIGWLIRKTDPIVLVVGFVLQDKFLKLFLFFGKSG